MGLFYEGIHYRDYYRQNEKPENQELFGRDEVGKFRSYGRYSGDESGDDTEIVDRAEYGDES